MTDTTPVHLVTVHLIGGAAHGQSLAIQVPTPWAVAVDTPEGRVLYTHRPQWDRYGLSTFTTDDVAEMHARLTRDKDLVRGTTWPARPSWWCQLRAEADRHAPLSKVIFSTWEDQDRPLVHFEASWLSHRPAELAEVEA